jgi:hypothetical protein
MAGRFLTDSKNSSVHGTVHDTKEGAKAFGLTACPHSAGDAGFTVVETKEIGTGHTQFKVFCCMGDMMEENRDATTYHYVLDLT